MRGMEEDGGFMFRGGKLKQRIVIDISTAERIGYVTDVEIDEVSGRIESVIINRYTGLLSFLFGWREQSIPWDAIVAMGREFVLVKSIDFHEKCLKN